MSLYVRKSGVLATIQDLGRVGHRREGINVGGAMDRTAARIAAILAGLPDGAAVVEMHFPAPEFVFENDSLFATAGADFAANLDGRDIENWRPHVAKAQSILRFERRISGARCYLAVAGGIGVESWLGSASTNLRANFGGFEGRALRKGDRISTLSATTPSAGLNFSASASLRPRYSAFPTVRFVAGREFELLDKKSRELFQTATFEVGLESDRMGFRLDDVLLKLKLDLEMISSAVGFGTIQLLPDGRPTILMADHQTTGGYPRIGHVIPTDLPLVAQLNARDKIGFHLVGLDVAEQLAVELEHDLSIMRTAIGFRLR